MVIWFQGCSLKCPGCFNPKMHSRKHRLLVPVERLVRQIEKEGGELEGITVSGGEPLEQAEALLKLLRNVGAKTELSVILFSGYTLDEIKEMPHGPEILCLVDVLVAGRYVEKHRSAHGLLGSSNQRIHYLSERYTPEMLAKTPTAELRIDTQGAVCVSGIDPPELGESEPHGLGSDFHDYDEPSLE